MLFPLHPIISACFNFKTMPGKAKYFSAFAICIVATGRDIQCLAQPFHIGILGTCLHRLPNELIQYCILRAVFPVHSACPAHLAQDLFLNQQFIGSLFQHLHPCSTPEPYTAHIPKYYAVLYAAQLPLAHFPAACCTWHQSHHAASLLHQISPA